MSRTIKEINKGIKDTFMENVTLQEAYNLLPNKSFDEQFSVVSIEAILINVFASAVWLHEKLWEQFKADTETMINNRYITSLAWYYRKALEFQNGDALAFDDNTYSFRYPVIDEKKQVVQNVAVREVIDENVTKLKVYFSDSQKQPFSGDIRAAFESYMRQIGAAGTHYLFVSQAPDEIRVHITIYYDPQILDSNGNRLSEPGKPVEECIENYFHSLEYGGGLYSSRLIDMIQATEGVNDLELEEITWNGVTEKYRKIVPESGTFAYMKNTDDITYLTDQTQ